MNTNEIKENGENVVSKVDGVNKSKLEAVFRKEYVKPLDKKGKKNDDFDNEDIPVSDGVSDIVDNANKYFLVKILAPEITRNEDKKRTHKDQLISIMKKFLIFQFAILSIIIIGTISMLFVFHGLGNDLSDSQMELIIKFVSLYITSVVIEIIAMLRYIVTKVFDTSISNLVELYKDKSEKDESDKQP